MFTVAWHCAVQSGDDAGHGDHGGDDDGDSDVEEEDGNDESANDDGLVAMPRPKRDLWCGFAT